MLNFNRKHIVNNLKSVFAGFFVISVFKLVSAFLIGFTNAAAFVLIVNSFHFWLYLFIIFSFISFMNDMFKSNNELMYILGFAVIATLLGNLF